MGSWLYTIFCILLNFVFVSFGWIFFRAESLNAAIIVLQRLFLWANGIHYIYIYTIIYGILLAVIHAWALFYNRSEGTYPVLSLEAYKSKLAICLVLWGIVIFAYAGDTAFIYFQF